MAEGAGASEAATNHPAVTAGAGAAPTARTHRSPTEAFEATQSKVILHEEALRSAAFGRAVAILSGIGLVVGALRELPLYERIEIMAATAALLVAGLGVWWRSLSSERHGRRTLRVFGIVAAASAMVLVHALGVFSPIVSIIVLGLAFFVHGRDKKLIYPVAALVILTYAAFGVLTTLQVLPDSGVWRHPGTQQMISMTVITTAVMVTQFVLARANQKAIEDALAAQQQAIRVAETREAQLDEAWENLDAALAPGRSGRLTGSTIDGWRVGDVVGRGAMGEVYAVTSIGGDRVAAIKVLRAPDDASIAKRFLREASIAKNVVGPNLVEVYETGQAPDGTVYIVMELLEGQDLAQSLRDETTLSLEETVALVEDTCRGLTILHQAGVIHRDLKPQNLFRANGPPPAWKILDYGVSKIVGSGTMTENQLVGTPGYMSPEQAEGHEIDARSDIFSLGAVAYRALTGRRPFNGPDTPQILYQVVHGTPMRPSEVVPSLPKEVDTVLAIALAKSPKDRYGTAVEMAKALRAAADGPIAGPVSRAPTAKVNRVWRERGEPATLTLAKGPRPSGRMAATQPSPRDPDEPAHPDPRRNS